MKKMPKHCPIIKQVYILRKFRALNRAPNPAELFVSDLIEKLSHLYNVPTEGQITGSFSLPENKFLGS